VIVTGSPVAALHRELIVALAIRHKVPVGDVRLGSKADIGLRATFGPRLVIQLCEQPHASQMHAWHRLCIDLADGGSTGGAWQCSAGLHSVAVVKLLAEFQQLSRLSPWHRLF
jgi:hypothetical protein